MLINSNTHFLLTIANELVTNERRNERNIVISLWHLCVCELINLLYKLKPGLLYKFKGHMSMSHALLTIAVI